jgi:FixJ family two-component response regulator
MVDDATVHVVDDEPDMRQALTRLFRSVGMNVVTYGLAREFLEAYRPGTAGCLVLDVLMPGMTGLELQRELNARRIALPVVFLSGAAHVSIAVEAMRAGATDFLEKPFDNEMLVARTRRAIALGEELRRVESRRGELEARVASLTPREQDVMRLMTDGRPTKLIADALSLSPRTVEIHRARIMEKMQAETLADLVKMSLALSG